VRPGPVVVVAATMARAIVGARTQAISRA